MTSPWEGPAEAVGGEEGRELAAILAQAAGILRQADPREIGDAHDERVREIWADIPQELGTHEAWQLARPFLRSAQLEADRALHGEGEPDRTPGAPHPDPVMAAKGWHVGPDTFYTCRQPEAELEAGG
jgi:hypothetical protein